MLRAVIFACGVALFVFLGFNAAPYLNPPAAAAAPNRATVATGDISGVITSSNGPEGGVWVIAETADLETKFRKIVVTNDKGQYLLPDLPEASYRIWVRGYGLVDSAPVEARPGVTLPLNAVIAPTARASAEYYPADYWASLLTIPPKSAFPITVSRPSQPASAGAAPDSGTPAPHTAVIQTQAEWLYRFKGCWTCHQVGTKSTRELPASSEGVQTSAQAWERALSAGTVGRQTIAVLNPIGHNQGLAMYADWGDRIANGELPPVPPRPAGIERNVVVTVWDLSVPAFVHAPISTDRRNPSVNAFGPVYVTDWWAGQLVAVDPVKNTKSRIIPLPNESEINMDGKGRIWFSVDTRVDNADYCKAASGNAYAKNSPREAGGKGVGIYDPQTRKFQFIDLCFRTMRMMFSDDKDQTVYFPVRENPGGIGWLNTRLWEETHDAEKSQGWCPAAPGIEKPGAYGGAYDFVDGSVWYSDVQIMPGRLIRMVRGANPPATCQTEVYEAPYDPKGQGVGGSHSRGIGIDSNGIVWTALTGEGNLASFDRRRCKDLGDEGATTGKHCSEGWTLYPIPGPAFKSDPNVKADYNYFLWVDTYSTLGLGKNVVIIAGSNSDSLIAFEQDSKQWVRMTIPYPMGFFSRFFDGRIDDAKAGWKGRGVWAANESRGTQRTDGGQRLPSQLAHFQLRPDPLAK
ncbi:MAG: carboxypeptidase-like regulatory domain-containing protein [Candidatus Acidiferrales bacterium]|jgi:hypothetical protein